ncbi:hypothetical protein M8C21_030830, partial [Ambrosia artemisiifolia]
CTSLICISLNYLRTYLSLSSSCSLLAAPSGGTCRYIFLVILPTVSPPIALFLSQMISPPSCVVASTVCTVLMVTVPPLPCMVASAVSTVLTVVIPMRRCILWMVLMLLITSIRGLIRLKNTNTHTKEAKDSVADAIPHGSDTNKCTQVEGKRNDQDINIG